MCGISGFNFSPSFIPDESGLLNSLENLKHRGPDDTGIFLDASSGVGLVHSRLSVLDLSPLGHQPMFSEDRRVILVFNGEIYNFRDLRAELEACGHKFLGHSDTEVLLHMYLECRDSGSDLGATLRRLNGIFAFALWDADRGQLLIARDALGVKPLYYSIDYYRFAFASEIKALIPLIKSIGKLDLLALNRYLSFLWCPGDSTPSENVKKVNPGEFFWIQNGIIAERHIWYRLPAFRPSPKLLDEAEVVEGVRQHLRNAVHRQLEADVPVGAFLSGGLDSSSVVSFAKEKNPQICCFTIDLDGGSDSGTVNDLPYARLVAKHLGVNLEVVRVDASRMANDLAFMVSQLDEPLADPASLNLLYISRLARECGIKVLLSGAGGDDLFTGYRRHRAVLTERYWNWLPHSVLKRLESLSSLIDHRSSWQRRLSKAFNGATLQGDSRLVNYFAWNQRSDLLSLYTSDFRNAVGKSEAADQMLRFMEELPQELDPLERMLALEQRFFLADHNLIYTDKMSMAAGVEVRVPFLDLELVAFAQRIPIRLKQRGSEGKWVLKKAMEPHLPKDVIYRSKSGFGAPLRRWMRFELRDLLGDVLGEASLRRRGLFEPVEVQKLIAANDAGRVDASYTLLSLLCIELWCRRFMDDAVEHSPIIGDNFR